MSSLTSKKIELISWQVDLVRVDLVRVDLVAIDPVRIDLMKGSPAVFVACSLNFIMHATNTAGA